MSKAIVKTCTIHGDLTAEQCYVNTYLTKNGLSNHYKCRECTNTRMKAWSIKNKAAISKRHKEQAYSKKYNAAITDSYIKHLLSKQYKCSKYDVPEDAIPLKRKMVELERAGKKIPEQLVQQIFACMEQALAKKEN